MSYLDKDTESTSEMTRGISEIRRYVCQGGGVKKRKKRFPAEIQKKYKPPRPKESCRGFSD